MELEREYFCLDGTVRGHHVYKNIWTPVTGQILQARAETDNNRKSSSFTTSLELSRAYNN